MALPELPGRIGGEFGFGLCEATGMREIRPSAEIDRQISISMTP
jgi:hypothetical protein